MEKSLRNSINNHIALAKTMLLANTGKVFIAPIMKSTGIGHSYRQVYMRVQDAKRPTYSQLTPPCYFQNINNAPSTIDQYNGGYIVPEYKHELVPATHTQSRLSIIGLFTNSRTRRAAVSLMSGILFLNCVFCYEMVQSRQQAVESEHKLHHTVMEGQVSRSIMAVHIGMLRKQLLDHNLIPVSSSQALLLSSRVLDLNKKENGSVRLDTRSISHSILPQLIPQHSDYDPSRVFKY